MSSFLSGIGRAIRAPGFGDRLQAALAAAGGDTSAISRLRALQKQQAELQRHNDARDAQVIGAKNLGFGNDDWPVRATPQPAALSGGQGDLPIGAMSPEDMSWAARQRIAARMFDPGGGGVVGREGEGPGAPPARAAPHSDTMTLPPPTPRPSQMPRRLEPIGTPGGTIPDGRPPQVVPTGYDRAPFSGTDGATAPDRNATIQQARVAIRRGADPKAVRARLRQIGVIDAGL